MSRNAFEEWDICHVVLSGYGKALYRGRYPLQRIGRLVPPQSESQSSLDLMEGDFQAPWSPLGDVLD